MELTFYTDLNKDVHRCTYSIFVGRMSHGLWVFLVCWITFSNRPVQSTIAVRGAGASFPGEVYKKWNRGYQQSRSDHINVDMFYESIGSGGGKARIKGDVGPMVHYAGSDSVLTDDEKQKHPNLKVMPTLVGAIILACNLPEIDNLTLDLEVVTGIYNGTITKWNDPVVVSLNPDIILPDKNIIVISRADKSGTTEAFTNGLSTYSKEWRDTYGIFSVGQGADGKPLRWNNSVVKFFGHTNTGMSGLIQSLRYSVGYMSIADAKDANFVYATLKNRDGFVVDANTTTLQHAIFNAQGSFALMNMPGELSYPLVAYTYLIVNIHTTTECSSMVELVRYINWFYHSEQATEDALYFSFTTLETTTINRIITDTLQNMTCNGENLWQIMRYQMEQESTKAENDGWKLPVYLTIGACVVIVLVMALVFTRQQMVIHREVLNNSWYISAEIISNVTIKKSNIHAIDAKQPYGNSSVSTVCNLRNLDPKKNYLTGVYDDQVLTILPLNRSKPILTFKRKKMLLLLKHTIQHSNVMRFLGLTTIDYELHAVYNGDIKMTLDDFLQHSQVILQEGGNIAVVRSVVSGMKYLHKKGIIHGNLRASNIVIGPSWNIQITAWIETHLEAQDNTHQGNKIHPLDFEINEETTNDTCAFWMSPELIKFNRCPNYSSDIYSFAMVVQEIFSRQEPFHELDLSPREVVGAVLNCCLRPKFYPNTPQFFKVLMENCWGIDPNTRPTFQTIEHLLKTEYPAHMSLLDTMIESMQKYALKLEEGISELYRQMDMTKTKLESQMTHFIPRPLVNDIATGKTVEAKQYESATAMAFMVTNLSELLSRTTCQGIINTLNKFYTGIDIVLCTDDVSKVSRFVPYDLYVAGVPKEDEKNAAVMSKYALRVKDFVGEFSRDHLGGMDCKLTVAIAMSSGPVISGVLGKSIPQYVVIGQALAGAGKLLETTSPGTIQLSTRTYSLLQVNNHFITSFAETLNKFPSANSADSDQTPHCAASDQRLHCLPVCHSWDHLYTLSKKGIDKKQQIDAILLDFSKAFDKVNHTRLLQKLQHYGIRGSLPSWIQDFLQCRIQQVVLDGASSDTSPVTSGVPQGSVLGPLLSLAYINDLPSRVRPTVRLFAVDCLIYRTIKNEEDATQLQEDLNSLQEWESKWLMSFDPEKCEVIHFTNNRNPVKCTYYMHDTPLKPTDSAKYLGVTLTPGLNWNTNLDNTTKMANSNMAFLRRNIFVCPPKQKETAYKTYVRSIVEYASTVWPPYTESHISQVEMVQRRAARFVMRNYQRTSSVTTMLQPLKWDTQTKHRQRLHAV